MPSDLSCTLTVLGGCTQEQNVDKIAPALADRLLQVASLLSLEVVLAVDGRDVPFEEVVDRFSFVVVFVVLDIFCSEEVLETLVVIDFVVLVVLVAGLRRTRAFPVTVTVTVIVDCGYRCEHKLCAGG